MTSYYSFFSCVSNVTTCNYFGINLLLHVCLLSIACENLIRRMLQLDPAKRMPLTKVLEHKWMQDREDVPKIMPHKLIDRTASGNILWNDKVLLAIQRLNFNVEAVKQVSHMPTRTCTYMYVYINSAHFHSNNET